jgi:hypothetical protein
MRLIVPILQQSQSNSLESTVAAVWGVIQRPAIAGLIASGAGLYMAYLLYRRSTSTADPSVRKGVDTAVGSYSMLASGAFAIAMLAGVVALVTWPMPVETVLGPLLLAAVLYSAGMEYRESREEGA